MDDYRIIVPAFNEEKGIYDTLVSNMPHVPKMVVVDDASTDCTYGELKRFERDHGGIDVLRMQRNSRKVGAVRHAVRSLGEEIGHVILSDADTTIASPPAKLEEACYRLDERAYAAASFRMLPSSRTTFLERMQNLEYQIANGMRAFLGKGGKQRCVPGAGGLYKRAPLEAALDVHSGDFEGDDFETTLTLQEMGYDVGYFADVEVRTSVPSTFGEKLKQRTMWERGSMKTYARKAPFVAKNAVKCNRLSFVTALDTTSHLTLPLALAGATAAAVNHDWAPLKLTLGYAGSQIVNTALLATAKQKGEKSDAALLPILPFYMTGLIAASRAKAYWDLSKECVGKKAA